MSPNLWSWLKRGRWDLESITCVGRRMFVILLTIYVSFSLLLLHVCPSKNLTSCSGSTHINSTMHERCANFVGGIIQRWCISMCGRRSLYKLHHTHELRLCQPWLVILPRWKQVVGGTYVLCLTKVDIHISTKVIQLVLVFE